MCSHHLTVRATCPVCKSTAVQIALQHLDKRGIPVLAVYNRDNQPNPFIQVDDFNNRIGREWIRYGWGRDDRGWRYEKHCTILAGSILQRTLYLANPPIVRCA